MRRTLLLLPLLAGSAWAQEFRWGLHVIGSTSGKDLAQVTDDATGFGLGLHAFLSDSAANALRMRLEGQTFQGKREAGLKTQVLVGNLTADWLHYFSGRTETGPYTALSAGLAHWRTQIDQPTQPTTTLTESRNAPLLAGGAGWQLGRTFGVEVQAWWTDRFRKDTGKAQGYTAMLTIRF